MGSARDTQARPRRLRRAWPFAVVALLGIAAIACEPVENQNGGNGQTTTPSTWRGKPGKPRRSTTTTTPSTPTTKPATPTTPTTPTTRPPASGPVTSGWWRPAVGSAWQIQLSTPVDESFAAPIYDIDGESNSAAVVASLHAKGKKVICYIDVGAAESYRADVGLIPPSVQGNAVDGWPQERWLDVRNIAALTPVMTARMEMCRSKGFDAVDPDLVEAYAANSGFPITYEDQLTYNRWIAKLAHERGMAVGLKGNVDQVKDLVNDFDFSVNEQCAEYDECATVAAFTQAGKPVFHIEYDLPKSSYCATTTALRFSSLRKNLDLDAWSDPC